MQKALLAEITSEDFIDEMINEMINLTCDTSDTEWHEIRRARSHLRKHVTQIACWGNLDDDRKKQVASGMKLRLQRSILSAFTSSLTDVIMDTVY